MGISSEESSSTVLNLPFHETETSSHSPILTRTEALPHTVRIFITVLLARLAVLPIIPDGPRGRTDSIQYLDILVFNTFSSNP